LRAKLIATRDVAQQDSLMTRLLPNQMNACLTGDRVKPGLSLGGDAELVGVQQHGPERIVTPVGNVPFDDFPSALDQSERVAASGIQHDGIEMNGQSLTVQHAPDQHTVTALAFAFATQEDAAPLRAPGAAHLCYPIRGTAP
jgi:hypothetical protein